LGVATLICAFILLIFSDSRMDLLQGGIVGIENLRPYSVIVLILSLSFICLTLEYAGFFEFVALKFLSSAGTGRKLFLNVFFLSYILTLFTNNDIVILTLTFIIFHICRHTKQNPMPYLFLQFFVTNIAGMTLYIGNPTNIIVADFAGIDFVEFAKWMILPSLVSTLACAGVVYLFFRRQIPERLETQAQETRDVETMRDRRTAAVALICLSLTILLMSLPKTVVRIPNWTIPLILVLPLAVYIAGRRFLLKIVQRIPWKIAPFLLGLFILVEGLAASGWTGMFSSFLSGLPDSGLMSVLLPCLMASWFSGFMNNHPMTVFFSRSLPSSLRGMFLAIIAGSDIGPTTMITGSLAGIMWSEILAQHGRAISFSEFSKYGIIVSTVAIILASFIIWLELGML
jgi:arsenical pump membrane protein